MLQELTEAHYGKGDFIFRKSDPTEYFHIVKDGTVKCVTSAPEGKEYTLKMLMPEDFFRGGVRWTLASRLGPTDGDVSIHRMKYESLFRDAVAEPRCRS
jgi:CRP/FNR family cyclic AMP-dependent transcriptional regulator